MGNTHGSVQEGHLHVFHERGPRRSSSGEFDDAIGACVSTHEDTDIFIRRTAVPDLPAHVCVVRLGQKALRNEMFAGKQNAVMQRRIGTEVGMNHRLFVPTPLRLKIICGIDVWHTGILPAFPLFFALGEPECVCGGTRHAPVASTPLPFILPQIPEIDFPKIAQHSHIYCLSL
jgi:hypothetical protein